MEALQCIKTRRSVRKYSDQPVTREVLDAIFDAVTYAPSWKNTQSVRYTVVESAELKARIADEAVLGFALNQKNHLPLPRPAHPEHRQQHLRPQPRRQCGHLQGGHLGYV